VFWGNLSEYLFAPLQQKSVDFALAPPRQNVRGQALLRVCVPRETIWRVPRETI
jgi:hypothetical protein